MKYKDALNILNSHIKNKSLIKHNLAVGAAMRSLARELGGDEEVWEIAGLLHDADWEETMNDPSLHGRKTVEWLKEEGCRDERIMRAILSHNYENNGAEKPSTPMEWALFTVDELTGLIVAVALVKGKNISSVRVGSVLKKFPAKSFARGVKREQIKLCEEKLGIPLERFVEITLKAMQDIKEKLGLA